MRARTHRPPRIRLLPALLLLASCDPFAARANPPLPLAVRGGRCEAVLETAHRDQQYYLVVGSLAREPGLFRVTVRTEPTDAPVHLPVQPPTANPAEINFLRELGQRLERARRSGAGRERFPPQPSPLRQRVFHLFTGDQDFQNPRAYAEVVGELRTVGRHCQVYVDRAHSDPRGLQATVDDAVRTFDEEIYPRACARLGHALDVDRDGRFTILFTGVLDRLQDGKVTLDGFVRGSDFYRDVAAPFGNRCDVMYLNTRLKPGPHLRTLLAHEYVHAVVFSEHVFGEYLPVASRQDEESWLNEALAHLNEEAHGYSWSNLDYRIGAFLSCPQRYRLVVRDYYADGVWRDPGTRGAAYLFLRACRARCGDDLPARLVRSNLQGVLNLEVATQRPFAELFRDWCTSLLQPAAPGDKVDIRRPLASRMLCGPRHEELTLSDGRHELRLAGTSAGYLLLHSPSGARTRVTVTADPAAGLQVTLVRVPRGCARLTVRCEPCPAGGGVRLNVTAHGAAVKLDAATWERLVPTGKPARDTSYRPGQTSAAWFGAGELKARETRRSEVLRLPVAEDAAGELVFKVTGMDTAGNQVTGWAVYAPATK